MFWLGLFLFLAMISIFNIDSNIEILHDDLEEIIEELQRIRIEK